jgi:DNA-binding CsgD family transcriptional regulator
MKNLARPGYVRPVELPVTPRMLDYLRAAAAGLTREETATHLWVTVETAKNMRKTVIRRLGARNTTHAVAIAYEKGLLP